jgi:predicted Holliday junction resolvase-like endonuclease
MNIDFKDLPEKLAVIGAKLRRFSVLIFVITVLSLYSFLVLHISSLTQIEADEQAVTEQLQTTKRPRIDQSAIEKIEDLQDQNVQINSLFQEARENPFSE